MGGRQASPAGLAVDLFTDDVGVSGMAGSFLDDREKRPPKVARLPVAGHRYVRVTDCGDDLVTGGAGGTVLRP